MDDREPQMVDVVKEAQNKLGNAMANFYDRMTLERAKPNLVYPVSTIIGKYKPHNMKENWYAVKIWLVRKFMSLLRMEPSDMGWSEYDDYDY